MSGKILKVFLLLTLLSCTVQVKGQLHFKDTRSFFKLTDTSFQEGQVFTLNILYNFGSYSIIRECYPHLDSVAAFIKAHPELKLEIGHHTDFRGSELLNVSLSEKRAGVVSYYFMDKGIPPSQITAKGYGENIPLIPPDTILKFDSKELQEKAHSVNRRTELTIIAIDENQVQGKSSTGSSEKVIENEEKKHTEFSDPRKFFSLSNIHFEIGQVFLMRVYYDFDAFVISSECLPHLDSIAEFIKANPELTFEIGSHTDFRGSNNYNLKLSEMRARGVMVYLFGKGIDSSRISAKGYGENSPVVPADTILKLESKELQEEAHSLNRRMELKILDVRCKKLQFKETRRFFSLSDSILEAGKMYSFTMNLITLQHGYYNHPQLDSILLFLNKHPDVVAELAVHTDFRGSKKYNLELSQKLAKYYYQERLFPKLHYPENLTYAGYGEDSPVIPESEILKMDDRKLQEQAHEVNRRIELKILELRNN